ncbi:hypothetical protein [Polaribacter aestuariivivens]|uniref:hypothetical protein n=1 Tax=Polaribacter aestuariivivens TaxID=2304626 RepID=UPI003F491640
MIDNLKALVELMDSKTEFVSKVCEYYGTSHRATMQNWFQGHWSIPEEKIPKVIEIAQKYLFAQSQRERKVLEETGFQFEKETA